MFKVRAVTAVRRYGRPLVAQNLGLGTARVHHRLNRQHHAFGQLRALTLLAKVRNLRRFMQLRPDAMPHKFPYHAEPVRFHELLDRRAHVSDGVADLYLLDALVQRSLGHFEQLLQFRGQLLAHRHGDGSVSVIPIVNNSTVDGNDVSRLQRPLFRWDPVHDLFIDRSAQHTWIAVISLERRRGTEFRDQFLRGLLQVHRRNAGRHHRFQVVQNLADHLPAPPHLFDLFRRLADDPVFSKTHSFVPLLASILAMTVNHAENLRRDLFHRPIRIDRYQPPLHPVVIRYPPGLRIICSQSLRDNFFAIVVADHQLGSVHITQLVDKSWLKVDVIEPSTGGTRTPPCKP